MFFKNKHKREFSIPVRYWDEEKEKQEQRLRRLGIKTDTFGNGKYVLPNLKGIFRKNDNRYRRMLEKQRRKSFIRLIMLVLILSILTYVFFGRDFFMQLF